MNEMGIKKDVAGTANASDNYQENVGHNLTPINIIAHELNKGKSAVYLKRDGWTMMPQLPEEEGEYLLLYRMEDGRVMRMTSSVWRWTNADGKLDFAPAWDEAIAWRPLPEIPAWAEEVAAEE